MPACQRPKGRALARSSTYGRTIAILGVVYAFNFLDRQILGILAQPIKTDLKLSDTDLGLLTGFMFAIFYTTFGIPVAGLADRVSRVRIIAAACALWSLFTLACGMATSFVQLAICRIGVGIGEAGGSPPAYSIIADAVPRENRGTALSLYSLGLPVGTMVGAALGGAVADAYGWRAAFVAAGLPGIGLALLVLLAVREPARGASDHRPPLIAPTAEGSLLGAVKVFFGTPVLALTAVGAGLSAFVLYALFNWMPPYLLRIGGMTLSEIAIYYSLVSGLATIAGTFAGGFLADRLSRRTSRAYALLPCGASLLMIPFLLAAIWVAAWQAALVFVGLCYMLSMVYLGPALVVVQSRVPPSRRSTAGALLLFVLNVIGLGGGPLFIGVLSDHFAPGFGCRSLQPALAMLVPILLLAAAVHFAASRCLGRDDAFGGTQLDSVTGGDGI